MSTNYKFYDSCGDTTTTTGTGTFTLTGSAPTGYNAIVATVSDGDKLTYRCETSDGVNWEVGEGVYTTSGTTLTRASILASSNAGSAVNFGSGTKNVYIVQPAEFMSAEVLTTAGDLLTHNGTQPTRLGVGSEGDVLTIVSGVPAYAAPSGGGGAAVLSGYINLTTATPYFLNTNGATDLDPTTGYNYATPTCVVVPKTSTGGDLTFVFNTQPGADTWTFTLLKNGSATSVVATMTGAVNTCSDNTHTVSLAAGDRIAIYFTTTGADPAGTPGGAFSLTLS